MDKLDKEAQEKIAKELARQDDELIGKPRLLSDGERRLIWKRMYASKDWDEQYGVNEVTRDIARAQWDICVKHYEKGANQ